MALAGFPCSGPSAADRIKAIASRVSAKNSIPLQGMGAAAYDTAGGGPGSTGVSPPATLQEDARAHVVSRLAVGAEVHHAAPALRRD